MDMLQAEKSRDAERQIIRIKPRLLKKAEQNSGCGARQRYDVRKYLVMLVDENKNDQHLQEKRVYEGWSGKMPGFGTSKKGQSGEEFDERKLHGNRVPAETAFAQQYKKRQYGNLVIKGYPSLTVRTTGTRRNNGFIERDLIYADVQKATYARSGRSPRTSVESSSVSSLFFCKINQAAIFLRKSSGKASFLRHKDAAMICFPRSVTRHLRERGILAINLCA